MFRKGQGKETCGLSIKRDEFSVAGSQQGTHDEGGRTFVQLCLYSVQLRSDT